MDDNARCEIRLNDLCLTVPVNTDGILVKKDFTVRTGMPEGYERDKSYNSPITATTDFYPPLLSFCIRSTMLSIRRYRRRLGLSSFRKCSALLVDISWQECELLRTALMDSPGCSGGACGVSGSPPLPWLATTSPFFFLSVLSELFFLKRPRLPPAPASEDDIAAEWDGWGIHRREGMLDDFFSYSVTFQNRSEKQVFEVVILHTVLYSLT